MILLGSCVSFLSFFTFYFIVFVLIYVIFINSVGHFWTSPLQLFQLQGGEQVLGIMQKTEKNLKREERIQVKIGNRDFYELDFRWLEKKNIEKISTPKDIFQIERTEYGDFYGNILAVSGQAVFEEKKNIQFVLKEEFQKATLLLKEKKKIDKIIDEVSYSIKKKKKLKKDTQEPSKITQEIETLQKNIEIKLGEQNKIQQKLEKLTVQLQEIGGAEKEILLSNIVRFYQPNQMGVVTKIKFYFEKAIEFIISEPREANTEGGIFPIIFGTVMLVFIMSIFCYPFGLAAAIYLNEYAKEGWFVRLVRIAVNNLAGVPSIVYGIFGLSFFVYGIGGSIDQLFFSTKLPNPTFGTGGILWASLTLSILTLPVVIVATEEALNAVPKGMKEGSLALGSTRSQTLLRVSIPIALPGIITGFILAIARAAGEVAPLLITGVVKLAPALPIDANFPFVHLDRKFMHLGFHIFDIAFQSPNVEASRPIVFVTTLLLLIIVLVMCSGAIVLRERLRKKYKVQQI